MQAIGLDPSGGWVGYVGVPHGVQLDGQQLFRSRPRCAAIPRDTSRPSEAR